MDLVKNIGYKDFSILSLFVSNIFLAILVYFELINIYTLIYAYIGQIAIIIFFSYLKAFNQPVSDFTKLVYYCVSILLFVSPIIIFLASFLITFGFEMIELPWLLLGLLIFFINHLFSYSIHKNLKKSTKQFFHFLMLEPAVRVYPLTALLIIFLNGTITTENIFLFIIAKTFCDLITHKIIHPTKKS
jgi:hypothetical protein